MFFVGDVGLWCLGELVKYWLFGFGGVNCDGLVLRGSGVKFFVDGFVLRLFLCGYCIILCLVLGLVLIIGILFLFCMYRLVWFIGE